MKAAATAAGARSLLLLLILLLLHGTMDGDSSFCARQRPAEHHARPLYVGRAGQDSAGQGVLVGEEYVPASCGNPGSSLACQALDPGWGSKQA